MNMGGTFFEIVVRIGERVSLVPAPAVCAKMPSRYLRSWGSTVLSSNAATCFLMSGPRRTQPLSPLSSLLFHFAHRYDKENRKEGPSCSSSIAPCPSPSSACVAANVSTNFWSRGEKQSARCNLPSTLSTPTREGTWTIVEPDESTSKAWNSLPSTSHGESGECASMKCSSMGLGIALTGNCVDCGKKLPN